MKNKLEAVKLMYRTNPVTPEALKKAEELGMIPMKDLKDGVYYKGSCRNARIAMWDAREQNFVHLRSKFTSIFAERINHPEKDVGFDVFIPVTEVKDWADE